MLNKVKKAFIIINIIIKIEYNALTERIHTDNNAVIIEYFYNTIRIIEKSIKKIITV